MKIYEVVFAETPDKRDDNADTIFLVRAPDYLSAIREVRINASGIWTLKKLEMPQPIVVHEVGVDLCSNSEDTPRILRGPYYLTAYNCGWKAYHRTIVGSSYIDELEEPQ